ncbi:MAG: class I SAM-dependent methyltransferase [Alphaproteobacteria bacterium]|jgi:ubiquinone/menaquinone biosynthesis C-methylase UbiE|nr:class I SAM-dependent methyltransferase [Alphaproteobacteria bacterium]
MLRPSKFWDRHAKGYARRPVPDPASYEKKLEMTRAYLKPDMQVLELGCGTGTTALIHAPRIGHITAVDISGGMLRIAREKAAAAGIANVTFQQSSIDDFNAPEASYDVVMCHSILHLLENKEDVIAKVWRMLKPDGLFVSSTGCLKGLFAPLRFILSVGHFLGLLPMIKFFSIEELTEDFAAAGFQIDQQMRSEKSDSIFVVAKKHTTAASPASAKETSG